MDVRFGPSTESRSARLPWRVQNDGPEVYLDVDHSQIVQLECLRSGI